MTRRRFLILGGGTAGWMTALLLERAFPDWDVTLVDSSEVGTIGVGEGSTPAFKSFMDAVGIAEHEWMPRCGATYKSGITFRGWTTAPGFESYFHPFLTHFDRDHVRALEHNALLRRKGRDVHAHPDLFCYSHYLASRRLCPIPAYSFPFQVQYGYHFDARALAGVLKEVALARGVEWRDCTIRSVALRADGDVSHVVAADGRHLAADFFVDCSGFASLITEKTLRVEFLSFADALFNDRALTIATDREPQASTRTTATALANGWAWHIPQQDKVGNGYVYSARHCSAQQAELELLEHLGLEQRGIRAGHVAFRTGRVRSVWNRNSLAVGLSQGFLEPLEATALALVQLTLARFVRYFRAGDHSGRYADQLNGEVAEAYEGVKDYIHSHFVTSNRDDSIYWRDCRANAKAVSPRLKRVIETWFACGDLAAVLHETGLSRHYKYSSWLYLLSGMGVFPPEGELAASSPEDVARVPLEEIRSFFERCVLNHLPQADALARLSAREPVMAAGAPLRSNPLEHMLGLDFALSAPAYCGPARAAPDLMSARNA